MCSRRCCFPLPRAGEADEEAICEALYVAAGFGQVIAARATLAGAEGGCQAEVGAASAMAAAALCHLKGGTPEQCAAAAAMALGNLLGLSATLWLVWWRCPASSAMLLVP